MSISTLILISLVSLLLIVVLVNKFIIIPEFKEDLELKIKKNEQFLENFYNNPIANYPGMGGSGGPGSGTGTHAELMTTFDSNTGMINSTVLTFTWEYEFNTKYNSQIQEDKEMVLEI